MALVTSDELAKDVASAEALLDRHQVLNEYFYRDFTQTYFHISIQVCDVF